MYEEFYGFREKPFQLVPNPAYLFKSSKHQNALTYLEYGISESVGFILLTGEVGSGKTTLIQYLLTQLGGRIDAAVIYNTRLSPAELLTMILGEFELTPSGNKASDLESLHRFLIDCYAAGRKSYLIIDEAQNLSAEALEEVRMLSNLHSDTHSLLQIMLVGQPELAAKLKHPSLRQFTQRIAASYHLTGISREETALYIAHRLKRAGGRPGLFTPAAADLVFEMSGGIPRAINLVCQAALVYGFADGAETIGQDVIHQIRNDELTIGCVIPREAAPAETGPASGEAFSAGSNGFKRQLAAVETELRELRKLVELQLKSVHRGAQAADGELVKRLKKMVLLERRRNEVLARKIGLLERKNLALRRLCDRERR